MSGSAHPAQCGANAEPTPARYGPNADPVPTRYDPDAHQPTNPPTRTPRWVLRVRSVSIRFAKRALRPPPRPRPEGSVARPRLRGVWRRRASVPFVCRLWMQQQSPLPAGRPTREPNAPPHAASHRWGRRLRSAGDGTPPQQPHPPQHVLTATECPREPAQQDGYGGRAARSRRRGVFSTEAKGSRATARPLERGVAARWGRRARRASVKIALQHTSGAATRPPARAGTCSADACGTWRKGAGLSWGAPGPCRRRPSRRGSGLRARRSARVRQSHCGGWTAWRGGRLGRRSWLLWRPRVWGQGKPARDGWGTSGFCRTVAVCTRACTFDAPATFPQQMSLVLFC